jgi:hypothetical protein
VDLATKEYINRVKKDIIEQKTLTGKILEIGSLDVNGEIKSLFPDAEEYVGVDIEDGPGVNIAKHLLDIDFENKQFDLVLSLNCLEHDIRWRDSFCAGLDLLNNYGCMIVFVPTETSAATFWRFPKILGDREKEEVDKYKEILQKGNISPINIYHKNRWPDNNVKRRVNNYFSESEHIPTSDNFNNMKTFLKRKDKKKWANCKGVPLPCPAYRGAHLTSSSKLVLSHNVHYTKENEYYQNVALGELLECLYTKRDYDKFTIKDCICSFSYGLQLGVVIQKNE